MFYRKLLVLNSLFTFSFGVKVKLPGGYVEGTTSTTLGGTKYHSFLAMRYAQPPVGPLRLKPPVPIVSWDGIYNATYEKNICFQIGSDNDLESEDCLFLNVFTPTVNLSKCKRVIADLPVLVWIHGGGFVSGAGYMSKGGFGPKFFMDANVILVTMNYRLGPFGFMSTGDETLPGNLGLKDQVLALKWVQSNIRYFGGDPGKVTVFGQSSGGSSVGYHLLSPVSRNLFRAAILQSGSALSPMGYQRDETNYTLQTVKLIDPTFNNTTSAKILDFLQGLDARIIDKAATSLTSDTQSAANYQISKGFFYAPVMEPSNCGAFLTKRQFESFETGDFNRVPVLIGNTDEESLALAKLGDLSFLWNVYDAEPSIMVPFDMHIKDGNIKRKIGDAILKYFAGASGFNNDTAKGIKYHSVHDLERGNIKQAELMANYTKVYFYQFSYSGKMGNNPYFIPGTGKVAHSEDLNYIFSRRYSEAIPDNSDLSKFDAADRTTHHRLISLWTNFAKHLNPTPSDIDGDDLLQNTTWTNVDPDRFEYLEIGENLTIKTGYPKPESYLFWTDLYGQYAVPPLDTF